MTRPLNFGYAPPQKLKINLTFQEQKFYYRRIRLVLLSHHSIELVEKYYFYDSTMVVGIMCGVFFCVGVNIFKFTR